MLHLRFTSCRQITKDAALRDAAFGTKPLVNAGLSVIKGKNQEKALYRQWTLSDKHPLRPTERRANPETFQLRAQETLVRVKILSARSCTSSTASGVFLMKRI